MFWQVITSVGLCVITQTRPNFHDGLTEPPLRLRYVRVITSVLYGCHYWGPNPNVVLNDLFPWHTNSLFCKTETIYRLYCIVTSNCIYSRPSNPTTYAINVAMVTCCFKFPPLSNIVIYIPMRFNVIHHPYVMLYTERIHYIYFPLHLFH